MDNNDNTILLFGIAREIINSDQLIKNYVGLSVQDVKGKLLDEFPKMTDIQYFMVAVNEECASDEYVIRTGDKIAIIPPVSGG